MKNKVHMVKLITKIVVHQVSKRKSLPTLKISLQNTDWVQTQTSETKYTTAFIIK